MEVIFILTQEKTRSGFHADAVALLEKFRLMDDDFFSEALDGKIDAVQFILNTVLERDDLKVIETKTQREYKNAAKRSIKLDIWALDREGRIMDIEIQRADKGTGAKRARIHSSMIDRDLLEKGQEFDEAAETYVIFITENDKYDAGLPLYHVDRTVRELNHQEFGDESHIVYVNGAYRDTAHPVGRLMHDFWCTKADDMISDVLAKEVRYMKESEEGRTSMCEMMENLLEKTLAAGRAEGREEGKAEGREEGKAEGIAAGRAEGKEEGKAEGKLIAIYEFVTDGIISVSEGAKRANLSEEEFQAGMDAYFAALVSA